ncbi:MAG: hypothetical protein R2867_06685 [Caldilineaceae bacterium]
MLGYLCTVLDSADGTPDNVGYGVGVAEQAKILADHAGFARDAANAGNRTEARRHAEHVLNILYGSNDPRYGDQDNDGVPTNPGDGFGLLPYREQMDSTLTQAAEATDATENVRTRVAQVQVALNNIGDGRTGSPQAWTTLLIGQAEALLAAGSNSEAQTFAAQVAAQGQRIYRGAEINDNGTIEPIAGEGGALTAYRYAQHAADFYPESLVLSGPTVTPTFTPTPTAPTDTATPTPTGTLTTIPPTGAMFMKRMTNVRTPAPFPPMVECNGVPFISKGIAIGCVSMPPPANSTSLKSIFPIARPLTWPWRCMKVVAARRCRHRTSPLARQYARPHGYGQWSRLSQIHQQRSERSRQWCCL